MAKIDCSPAGIVAKIERLLELYRADHAAGKHVEPQQDCPLCA